MAKVVPKVNIKKEAAKAKMYLKILDEMEYFEKSGLITIIMTDDDCILFSQAFTKNVNFVDNSSLFQPYSKASDEEFFGPFIMRFTADVNKAAPIKNKIIKELKGMGVHVYNVESHKQVQRILEDIHQGEV
jgi:hypothetical protein